MGLDLDHKLEVWKTSIETQKHFAELSIKMRQIGLTLAGATISLSLLLFRIDEQWSVFLPNIGTIHLSTILCWAAAIILYGVKIVDVDTYHKMLRGAVRFNELFEITIENDMKWRAGLTETISAHSRYDEPKLLLERDKFGMIWSPEAGSQKAGDRIARFYWICIVSLGISGVFIILAQPISE